MARVNVFGKPIVYDVGSVIVNGVRQPPPAGIKEGDDVTDPTKAQLAQYMAEQTSDNELSVPASPATVAAITDQNGFPAPLSDANPNKFSTDSTNLNSYSDSSQNTGAGGVSFLKKGKKQGPEPDGNKLLKSVNAPDDQAVVPKYTSKILSQNRFTDAQKRNGTEQFRVNPSHPIDTLGSWKNFRNASSGKDFNDGTLAHVGTLLALRATKELGAGGAYGRDGPDGAAASAAAILPGGAQSGLLKVDVSKLDALDVLDSLIDDKTSSANLDASKATSMHTVLSIGSDSYGQMNNPLEPFSGLLPLGMIGLSTALVLALKVAIKAVLALFLLITSASKSASQRTDNVGRYFLGNYNKSAAFDSSAFPPIPLPASLFGLRETVHPFGDAVDAGIDAFFGGGVGDSFARILETPGFYAVFCRAIIMSAATITDSIKNVVKGNPIQIAQNVIELVNVIKSSKVVSAMNVFAEIGDAALTAKDNNNSVSMIDDLDDQSSTGFKSRLQNRLALAWGVGNSPSAYLLPASFQSSLSVYSQLAKNSLNPALVGLIKSEISSNAAVGTADKTLDHSVVETLEAKLDAEYMPFYFHDLRTHEIVAFPAFITSISDDFSVNWESNDGFGRVDAVKIYKSTSRKISISFIVASTSPEDFDQMWWKINKFVTMVYPQWSEGTLLQNSDDGIKFVQPFSQVMTSSPIVRIRLGDLFRSNYSRFALARLFGVGQTERFQLPGLSSIQYDPAGAAKLEDLATKHFDPDKTLDTDVTYDALPGNYDEAEAATGALGAAAAAAVSAAASAIGASSAAKPKDRLNIATRSLCVIKKAIDKDTYNIVFVDSTGQQTQKKTYVARRAQLSINRDSLVALMQKNGANVTNVTQSDVDALGKFFDAKQNAIVRSFESVSGKGLACTIDSLNFSWLDNFVWETEVYGARAPKMCKISINITPIHDIAPGIDSDGFNRAPVYNVGQAVNAFGGDSYDDAGNGRKAFDTRVGKLFSKTFRR